MAARAWHYRLVILSISLPYHTAATRRQKEILNRAACIQYEAVTQTRASATLLAQVLWTACAGPVREAAPTLSAPPGKDPVLAALAHFHALPDLWLPASTKPKGVLLVDRNHQTSIGFNTAAQLSSDLSDEGWSVPEDARLDLERRTSAKGSVSLSSLPAYIRLIDSKSEQARGVTEFSQRHPDAKCHISLWPTGFTRDGKRAIVRFLFGPTPHGASAVYLLERRGRQWHVVEHNVSYYV
jgi:hypothetical protein